MAGAVSQRSLSLWLRRLASAEPAEAEKARRWLLAHPDASLPRLLEALDDEDETLRWRIIALLPLFGSSRCAAPLAALLHDPSEAIRCRAAAALARVSSRRSVPALTRLIERETSHRVRWAATRALVRLAQTGRESALGPLLAIIGDPAASARIRVTAMAAIPWMTRGRHDTSARRLLEALAADPEPSVASRARRMLSGGLGTRLEPWTLGRLLDDLASRRKSGGQAQTRPRPGEHHRRPFWSRPCPGDPTTPSSSPTAA
ncbi:MAG: HEAT repeat domain-containing protein [Acidobacteriota bacterium]|nr:HEAT repeat domain-containing protein [Acidobacteriota bacterium]